MSSTTKTSSLQDVQTSLGIGLEADMEIGLFAGEFSARFDMKQMQMSTTEAYSVDARIVYAHLSMDNYNQTTPAPMRAGVQEDLDGVSIGGRKVLSPDEILDNYGTHYVKGFDLGTMIVLSFSNDTSRNTTELDLSAALSARYGEAGEGGGGKLDTEMSKKVASQMASIKQDVRAWGVGDEELQGLGLLSGSSESSISSLAPAADNGADAGGHDDAADATASPFDILKEGWHNPTLIAVDPRNLVEISTLCKNRKRAAAIKAAYLARQAQVAAGLPAALGLLTPLYRFRIIDSGQSFYRFNQAITPPSEGSWAENCNGQPAFCVRTSPADGLMPLYACRYKGMNWWRYETSTWDDWLKAVGQGNW